MANLIEILIVAEDRASEKLDNVSRSASKASLVIAAIGTAATASAVGLGGLLAATSLLGVGLIAASGAGAAMAGSLYKVFQNLGATEEELAKLTPQQREAIKATNALIDSYWKWSQSMETENLTAYTQGLQLLDQIMWKLQPGFKAVAASLAGMMTTMNQAVAEGKVDDWFNWINTYAAPAFEMVMKSVGNILVGLGGILKAFTPLAMDMGAGLVELTAKFAAWATTLESNPAFQNFVTFVRENTPIVLDIIAQLWQAFLTLTETLRPFGELILQLVQSFLQWFNTSDLVKQALDAIRQAGEWLLQNIEAVKVAIPLLIAAFLGIKAILTIVTIINNVAKAVGAIRLAISIVIPVIRTAATAFRAFALSMMLNPVIAAVVVAIGILIGIGITLYKNWDTITEYAKKLWEYIKKTWDDCKKAVSEAATDIIDSTKKMYNDTIQAVTDMYNSVIKWFKDMWNSAKQTTSDLVNNIVDTVKNSITSFKNAVSDIAKGVVQGFKDMWNDAKNAVSDGIRGIISTIKGWITSFTDAGKGLIGAFTDGIKSTFGKAKSAVQNGLSDIRRLLPFSPAKEGPLSDLDKSGAAFFPTWYNAALTKVPAMTKAISGAMQNVRDGMEGTMAAPISLGSFSGGSVVVQHQIVHSGTVDVKGQGGTSEAVNMIGGTTQQQVINDFNQQITQRLRRR